MSSEQMLLLRGDACGRVGAPLLLTRSFESDWRQRDLEAHPLPGYLRGVGGEIRKLINLYREGLKAPAIWQPQLQFTMD